MHKVKALTLVRQGQNRSRRSGANSPPAAAPSPNRQALLTKNTLGLLAVDHHALPAQQDVQASIAEPATLVGKRAQPLAKRGIVVPRGTVTHALAIGIDNTARPPLAHPMTRLEMSDRFPLGDGRHHFFVRRSLATPPFGSTQHCPASYRLAAA